MAGLNITELELRRRNISLKLQHLSDERAIELLPVIVFLLVLSIIGIIGNSLVVYIFTKKFKVTTQTTLFVALACFDLISCSLAMPFEVFDLRFFFNFSSEIACKSMRSLVTFTTCASNQILLLIAIDRFRKVCCPLQMQMTPSIARKFIFGSVIIAIVMTIPAFFLYGLRSAITPIPGLLGSDCATGDDVKDTIYPIVYEFVLIFFFVFFTTCFAVLYTCIWRASRRLAFARKSFRSEQSCSLIGEETTSSSIDNRNDKKPKCDKRTKSGRSNVVIVMKTESFCRQVSSEPGSPNMVRKRPPRITAASIKTKATLIAFAVTLVFFLSFIPHLGLAALKNTKKDYDYSLQGPQLVAFNFFLRFYFVNCVANPFIYSAMNPIFRRRCYDVFRYIFCCVCRACKIKKDKPVHV